MGVSTLITAMLLMSGPAEPGEAGPTSHLIAEPILSAAPLLLAAQPVSIPEEAMRPVHLPVLPGAGSATDQGEQENADDDIIVQARPRPPAEDPLQGLNLQTYAIVQTADKLVVEPAAKTYSKVFPSFFRSGLRHFFNNLNEPVVALNYLLQHKIGKAFETVGRFGINSTLGVAGVVDVAKKKPFNLPKRRNGFANTMGFYGVKPGPFLFIPLVGPTTVRDLLGLWVDKLVLPAAIGKPFNRPWYVVPSTIIGTLDDRVEFADKLQEFRASPDPYAASRSSYLQSRQAEIEALHVHRHRKVKPEVQPEEPAKPSPPNGAE